jgi:hypothetical protein
LEEGAEIFFLPLAHDLPVDVSFWETAQRGEEPHMSRKPIFLLVSLLALLWMAPMGCDTPEKVDVERYPSRATVNATDENATMNATGQQQGNSTAQ